MTLSKTSLGPFELFAVETGRFRLDAGAMFGVVPRTLWSRHVEADAENRMLLATRCLLIRSSATGRIYLVDNGWGRKFDEKMAGIYGIDLEHSDLDSSLEACGVSPDEVTDLIFTHLHFDHCGGTTWRDGEGALQHHFCNARYHVTEAQLHAATVPNARERATYLRDNVKPIEESDRLQRLGDQHSWEEGLYSLPAYGHTAGMQLPVVEHGGTTIVFASDLVPTRHHLPLPWVMAYDMQPLVTLREKELFLDAAAEKGWYLFMEHDPDVELLTVVKEEGRYRAGKTLTLADLPA